MPSQNMSYPTYFASSYGTTPWRVGCWGRRHEIREDIEDAVKRMAPRRDVGGRTIFTGYSSMALPLKDFRSVRAHTPAWCTSAYRNVTLVRGK